MSTQQKVKTCTRCGVSKKLKEYKPNGANGKLRAMCYECQRGYANATYRLNHERQTYACLLCGSEYETRKANRRYCSEQCRVIASTARYKREVLEPRKIASKERKLAIAVPKGTPAG